MEKISIGSTEVGKIRLAVGSGRALLTPEEVGVLATALLDKARFVSDPDAEPEEGRQRWEFTRSTSVAAVNIPNQPEFVGLVLGFGEAFVGLGFSPEELREFANQILRDLDERNR